MSEIDSGYARQKFEKRFAPLAASGEGITAASLPVLREHLAQKLAEGRITHRQAERFMGYLTFGENAGYPARTRYRRRRELRDHGLVLVDPLTDPIEVDLGAALEEALSAWEADCAEA